MITLKNLAVATASLVLFSTNIHAQTLKANNAVNANGAFKVRYIGDEGDYLVFEVTPGAPKTTNAVFSIYDKNEGELYASYYTESSKAKTIKIEKTDNSQLLDFKMVIGKKTFSKSFAANTSVLENINVTENSITKL